MTIRIASADDGVVRASGIVRARSKRVRISLLGGVAFLAACHEIDPICEYGADGVAEIVDTFAILDEAPMLEGVAEHPSVVYQRFLALTSPSNFSIIGADDGQATLELSQSDPAELRRYTTQGCPADYRWIEVPTRVVVSDSEGEWRFDLQGQIRLNTYEELLGSFQVIEVVVGGAIAESVGAEVSDDPAQWFASTNQGFEDTVFLVMGLSYGNPNSPGSQSVIEMTAESE